MTVTPDMDSRWHMAVLIPARDEEALLPRCVHSVLRAANLLPSGVTVDIIVVADCCTDSTESLARSLLSGRGEVLQSQACNVGAARTLAAQMALARSTVPSGQCWLANTDADCEVPETWLLHQLRLAEEGWAAVAGIVDVDCFAEHLSVVESRFRATYAIHADGTHPHVHGANLGVRADVYTKVGGWQPLQTAEDHALWNRLRQFAVPCCSDASLQVLTSGRRKGRAPAGFADALAKHNEPILQEVAV